MKYLGQSYVSGLLTPHISLTSGLELNGITMDPLGDGTAVMSGSHFYLTYIQLNKKYANLFFWAELYEKNIQLNN